MTEPRRRTRRPHPARGGRIAAVGVGASALLGMVGAMGLDRPSSTPDPAGAATASPQLVVVVHRTVVPDPVRPADDPPGSPPSTTPPERPTVRPAPTPAPAPTTSPAPPPAPAPTTAPAAPAPAPTATTSGSR